MAGCDAVTYILQRPNRDTLREWKFMREGWLFAAGILRKPGDRSWVEVLGLKCLDTWEWLPGTVESIVPYPSSEAPTEVTEITESVVTSASVPTVWALIRNVEHNALLHDNVVGTFKVPGTPDGVGEEQAVVLEYPDCRRTITTVIVEEQPLVRLVTRTYGRSDPWNRQVYTLESTKDGTRVSVSMRYSVGVDTDKRTREATNTRIGIHDYLSHVARVLAEGWTDSSSPEDSAT
jgi:hypothetical protein